MGIVRFALRWPYTFYVLALLILFLGVTAFRSMPTDISPEIDIPVVTVIWQYTGLSTPEMEQRVTTYSEYALSTAVSGIKDIEAQTLDGISVQKIYFQPDVSIDLAIAQIISATNYIRLLMPIENSHRLLTEEGKPLPQATLQQRRRYCRADAGLDTGDQLRVHFGRLSRWPGEIPVHPARPRCRVRNARVIRPLADTHADHDRAALERRALRR
jgi:hypothetical protein